MTMKYKVSKLLLTTAVFSVLFTVSSLAQDKFYVYNDSTSSGMWFQGSNGGEVANPVSDEVNSSENVAKSATDGNWQQIQYFPTYSPVSGSKLFFSVHNPNGAGPGQIQFSYTGSDDWKFGANVNYESGSTSGWVEYSIDLESHVGNEIDQVIIIPAGDNSAATYVDNVYFQSDAPTQIEGPVFVYNDSTSSGMWFQGSNGGEVANPVSDEVNSSENVAKSATDGNWQQIQYFPTYSPVSGSKLFFSVHNPNGAGPGQIQFSYTGSDDWKFGANVNYESGSTSGWVEYSIDLESHVGNEIDQVIIIPAGDNSAATYVDNVYFHDQTLLISSAPAIYVYNESTSTGMWFQGSNGGEVANPVSDEVNSSENVAKSATDGNWQQIQYFPSYSPESGSKLFFSVHNPNGAGPGQIQFSYTGSDDWKFGANVTYESGSTTGWVEYSIDLESHVGNEIDQIIIIPAGDNSAATYVDNIYFSDSSELTVSTDKEIYRVESFSLNQNYPNPFNPSTTISFTLRNAVNVTLRIYNVIGQEVATLINGNTMNMGTHTISFNASSLSSGMYLYRLEAGSFTSTKTMMLIK